MLKSTPGELHFHIQVATLLQQLSNAAQDIEKGREKERAWQESLVKERTNFQQCGRKELAELQNLFRTKIKKKIFKIIN